jgi:hypothetical protein
MWSTIPASFSSWSSARTPACTLRPSSSCKQEGFVRGKFHSRSANEVKGRSKNQWHFSSFLCTPRTSLMTEPKIPKKEKKRKEKRTWKSRTRKERETNTNRPLWQSRGNRCREKQREQRWKRSREATCVLQSRHLYKICTTRSKS